MFKKILTFGSFAGLIWLGYSFIYYTPHEKDMQAQIREKNTTNTFLEGFENMNNPAQLFAKDWSRWHELLLQDNTKSLRRPIRYCLINPLSCFTNPNTGNYLALSTDIRRRGKNALKFHAAPGGESWFSNSRIALRRNLFDFKKGDDIYFSGWFYFVGDDTLKASESDNLNRNMFLSFRSQNESLRTYREPGPALYFTFRNNLELAIDNWLPAIEPAKQDLLNRVQTPVNEWVEIELHLKLSDSPSEGMVEVWQNKRRVLTEKIQTLPTADTVYSILEVGIGSNLNPDHSQTMYVDNLRVSPTPFN